MLINSTKLPRIIYQIIKYQMVTHVDLVQNMLKLFFWFKSKYFWYATLHSIAL